MSITRERLLEIIVTGPEASGAEQNELASMALAAMDSEPVAYTDEEELNFVNDMACMWTKGMGINEVPLYRHAHPAPVVPNGLRLALSNAGIAAPESDEMLAATCEKHIQALVTWVKDRKPFQSAPVVPSFEEWLSAANRKPLGWVKDAMREAFDACRAAMLAAAPQSPGSETAPVPGKWIPVSERMPEVGVKVLCFPVKDEPIHATFNGQLWLQDISWSGSDEPIDNVIPTSVTHWMPLPAAPQEVR
ncbi:DUF551 domain-containing protein [Klebsiella pneumoniae]|uniref:DUF551 domain-containing protein n=2 Tax=Klebsiella pneumoniae TaxID=573 RepID=UPI0021559F29|nr:DUF551 domain-containing protein [Klebsiella pneumoniae]MBW5759571.1 DUF551 domain-containing protein [Klebsiella pneumoniae]